MSQRLRSGVDLYAVGFIVNKEQMAEIATHAFPSSYLDQHGRDPVLALKWHVDEDHFEVLHRDFDKCPDKRIKRSQDFCHIADVDTIDAQRFFFAVHFYPWHVGPRLPSEVADIPPARRALWQAKYGQYASGRCTEVSRAYPKFLGYPYFLQSYIEGVVMHHKLGDLLEPDVGQGGRECARAPSPAPSLEGLDDLDGDLEAVRIVRLDGEQCVLHLPIRNPYSHISPAASGRCRCGKYLTASARCCDRGRGSDAEGGKARDYASLPVKGTVITVGEGAARLRNGTGSLIPPRCLIASPTVL
ncbi:hypothetical protein B0H11DRAFT_2319792 [Mycena galericulata]|nr:hypothetical protein B0H11DRAFT_2319792 [Mycena galericulata]